VLTYKRFTKYSKKYRILLLGL